MEQLFIYWEDFGKHTESSEDVSDKDSSTSDSEESSDEDVMQI